MELHPLVDETGQSLQSTAHTATFRRSITRTFCTGAAVLSLLGLAGLSLGRGPLRTQSLRLSGLDAIWTPTDSELAVNVSSLNEQAMHAGSSSVATSLLVNITWPPSKLLNTGKNCWQPCGNVSGDCSWCGLGNACCRLHAKLDPPECQGVTFATSQFHTCVRPSKLHPVKHSTQDCLSRCDGRSGYCSWCGKGNACCMEKAKSVDAPECRNAYAFPVDDTYRCVPTLGLCPFGKVEDGFGGCKAPDEAPTLSFYMYKASAPYWPRELNLSTNLGSLAGVLWYLHNDIVTHCPRKHGIDRILRYYVTVKPTDALYKQDGREFDSFVRFTEGQAADPDFTREHWHKLGYNVGCQQVDPERSIARYQDTVWYSLPGRCPSKSFRRKSTRCQLLEPGGYCDAPNGTRTCTWTAQFAGEVFLDEMAGISDPDTFCTLGGFEYDLVVDKGIGNSFWNGKLNFEACSWRVQQVHQQFEWKYPTLPMGLDRSPCH